MRRFADLAEFTAACGEHLGRSGWHWVDQDRVDRFADLAGDHQWLHLDPLRAAEGPFGGTVAHGYLTLSLLPALLAEIYHVDGVGLVVNTGLRDLAFLAPVPVGAEVRLSADLVSAEQLPRGAVAVELDVALQVRGTDSPALRTRVCLQLRPTRTGAEPPPATDTAVPLAMTAVEVHRSAETRACHDLFARASGGHPLLPDEPLPTLDLELDGVPHRVDVTRRGRATYRVTVDGLALAVEREPLGEGIVRHRVGRRSYRVAVAPAAGPPGWDVTVDGTRHRVLRGHSHLVVAPSSALLVDLPVGAGELVTAGAPVAVLEQMKLQSAVPAPATGRVAEVFVRAHEHVRPGQPLARIVPAQPPEAAEEGCAAGTEEADAQLLPALRARLLGYDVTAEEAREHLRRYTAVRGRLLAEDPGPLAAETALLEVVADVWELTRRRPRAGEERADPVHTPHGALGRWLGAPESGPERLPPWFGDRLAAVTRHLDLPDPGPAVATPDVALRVARAAGRADEAASVVGELLRLWASAPPPSAAVAATAGAAAARLARAAERRHPRVGDLVLELQASWSDTGGPAPGAASPEAPDPGTATGLLAAYRTSVLAAPDGVLLRRCAAHTVADDVRLVAQSDVGTPEAAALEAALLRCVHAVRRARARQAGPGPLDRNHVLLHVRSRPGPGPLEALRVAVADLAPDAGLFDVTVIGGGVRARLAPRSGCGVELTVCAVDEAPAAPGELGAPLDDYARRVLAARRREAPYPYELLSALARGGSVVEHDLDPVTGQLVAVERPPGGNRAGIVVAVVTTPTAACPEGMRRVAMLSDPTRSLGSVAGPECARVTAALDLACRLGVPVEWFTLSAGARIALDSGTENMDAVASTLRRIVEFTQGGGELNVVVTGITVGAQPYWNAEATMLMHTKGILVMTPDSAMVLAGKQSLEHSGGVAADDNLGIGGYEHVMGPNGQAHYWADTVEDAVEILFRHYEYTYLPPGGRGGPRATTDPTDRDVRSFPHIMPGSDLRTVGDIFCDRANPARKKPFDIRTVMRAVADADRPPLERWAGMAGAETAVVLDAHLGGYPVCLIGVESRPLPRRDLAPSDGPGSWTAGTLFPGSSRKVARALNAASGNRPVVVLANLSGFDGSPESMRSLQLEHGAEIGRAIVNFRGPVVLCVVSRYHGGAFVVFSRMLNEALTVLAVEGSHASVIGGGPAAAVVLSREVEARTSRDERVCAAEQALVSADVAQRFGLRADLATLRAAVRAAKRGEVAAEFDAVHSIRRAVQVGSVDAVIGAHELRPRLVEAVAAGLAAATC